MEQSRFQTWFRSQLQHSFEENPRMYSQMGFIHTGDSSPPGTTQSSGNAILWRAWDYISSLAWWPRVITPPWWWIPRNLLTLFLLVSRASWLNDFVYLHLGLRLLIFAFPTTGAQSLHIYFRLFIYFLFSFFGYVFGQRNSMISFPKFNWMLFFQINKIK